MHAAAADSDAPTYSVDMIVDITVQIRGWVVGLVR